MYVSVCNPQSSFGHFEASRYDCMHASQVEILPLPLKPGGCLATTVIRGLISRIANDVDDPANGDMSVLKLTCVVTVLC
jgi:hypothetical protein